MIKKLILIVFALMLSVSVFAQEKDSSSFWSKNIKISGEAGAYGELYSISGIASRRPSNTWRMYVRPSLTLFDLVTIPFEFFVSSEGSSARQSLNRFGISPSWSWGRVHAGDFTEDYGELSLSGVGIRGAGFYIYPGLLRLSTVAGYISRSVEGGAGNGSYDRFLFGAKIGIGEQEDSYFDLNLIKVKDMTDGKPIDQAALTIITPNGNDEIPAGSLQVIKWNSVNVPGNVKIEISRDGGLTYTTLVTNLPNTGYYNWTVEPLESYQTYIKITSESNPSLYDISDYSFKIAFGINYKQGDDRPVTDNPLAVTPQENLVISANGQLKLFDNTVVFTTEAAGSVFTKDLRSDIISTDSADIPEFVTKFYKPHVSTNADFAVNSQLQLNFSNFNLKGGFKLIGAGFNSLGLPYLINDIKEIFAGASANLYPVNLSVNYSRVSDNVIDQKLFTTSRNQFTAMASAMLTDWWNSTLMFSLLDMGNDSPSDTTKASYNNTLISASESFMISRTNLLRSLSVNYSYQGSENKTFYIKNGKTNSQSANVSLNFVPMDNFNAGLSAGLTSITIQDTMKMNSSNINAVFSYLTLENKLTASLSTGLSLFKEDRSINTNLSGNYSLTPNDNISLIISLTNFSSDNIKINPDFDEFRSMLSFTHRF